MQTPAFIRLPGDAMAAPAPIRPLASLRRMLAHLREWNLQRRTLAEIGSLPESTLRDIGVTRSDLAASFEAERARREVREAIWRDRS